MSTEHLPAHAAAHGHEEEEEGHGHPGPRTYVIVGVVLAVITMLEVYAYTAEAIRPILVPILLVLSATKFVLVVGFYMHLKFDARIFTWLFVFGLAVACAAISGLWALFNGWGG